MTNDAYDPQTGEIEPVDQLAEGNLVAHADVALIQALNKSEIDIQITTAKTYPRSIRRFINSTTEMVTLSPQVAEECMYTLPRGGKAITGASVRFAEIIKGAWGNNRIAARVVGEDARFIRAQGLFHDLETNSAVTIEVSRRITDSKGKRYNDDMISVTGNAATSIAMRNAILRGIPKALWFPLYQRAIATAAGDVKTMPERRKTMFEQFKALGAEKVQLMRWLEVAGEEDIGVEQFMTLAGLLNTFKDGQVNVVEFFEKAARGEDAGGDDKRPERGGKKKAPAVPKAPATKKADDKPKDDGTPAPAADASKTDVPKDPPPADEKPPTWSDKMLSYVEQVEEATTTITTNRLLTEAKDVLDETEHAALVKRVAKKNDAIVDAAKKKR